MVLGEKNVLITFIPSFEEGNGVLHSIYTDHKAKTYPQKHPLGATP